MFKLPKKARSQKGLNQQKNNRAKSKYSRQNFRNNVDRFADPDNEDYFEFE